MPVSSVVDASVLVSVVSDRGPVGLVARRALAGLELCALDFTDIEVLSGLRGRWLRAEVTAQDLEAAVADYVAAPLARYPTLPLAERIVGLAHNLSAYDAGYVALAESLGAPLITADARLAAAPGIACEVVLIGG